MARIFDQFPLALSSSSVRFLPPARLHGYPGTLKNAGLRSAIDSRSNTIRYGRKTTDPQLPPRPPSGRQQEERILDGAGAPKATRTLEWYWPGRREIISIFPHIIMISIIARIRMAEVVREFTVKYSDKYITVVSLIYSIHEVSIPPDK